MNGIEKQQMNQALELRISALHSLFWICFEEIMSYGSLSKNEFRNVKADALLHS